jgi:hypothetical protein
MLHRFVYLLIVTPIVLGQHTKLAAQYRQTAISSAPRSEEKILMGQSYVLGMLESTNCPVAGVIES